MLKNLRFEQVGRNCFNPSRAVLMSQYKLEIWPGFYSALSEQEGGVMVQIDLTSRVVRQEKVLPYIKDLMRKFNND